MYRQNRFDVAVLGELNVDIILNRLSKFPEVGKEIFAESLTTTLGSSSAIFASNLSTLGSSVTFAGIVGDDNNGDQIISSLKSKGVDVSNIIRTENCDTGVTVVLNYAEDRAMATYPGPMARLRMSDLSENIFTGSRHLHVSSIFLQKGLQEQVVNLYQKAKSFGLTTSLDPQWDPLEKWDIDWRSLLMYVDIFLPNEAELLALTSTETSENAIKSLKGFANTVVVKRGRAGAILASGEQQIQQQAFLNESVIDSIGAGDSFDAGFIHKYLQGKPLTECLKFAALAGAVNTTGVGGTGAFKDIEAVKTIARTFFNYTF